MPRIIAENEYVIAIDKPLGLIAHRDGRTEEPSVAEWLGETFPSIRGVGGVWRSPQGEDIPLNGLAHRLDRTTSGVMLVAKTQESFEYLKGEFKARRIEKKYLALIAGKISEHSGTIVAEIMRSGERPKRWYARACDITDTRAAITEWRVIRQADTMALIEASPKTGRTHQIRVHFASIGHPLVGDGIYGGDISAITTPALHAASISLTLPDGEKVTYESSPPGYFEI